MGKPRKPKLVEPEPIEIPPEDSPSLATRARRAILKTFFRPKRLLALTLIPILGILSPIVWRHWPDLDANPIYRVQADDFHITLPPRPIPSNLVEKAIGTKELSEGFSLLDETLLPRFAEAFAKEPWVKRVVQLRKELPARVTIELEYRRPVAMIDVKTGVYPVDDEGVLLPPKDFTQAEILRYPLVTGVRSLPAGPPGAPWGDATVVGAAKIAASLAIDWDTLDLASIHAPPLTTANPKLEELNFELRSRGGSKIVWGRPPGTGHPGELTVDQKLGRLKQYVADFGPLDSSGTAYEIDIRPWQEMTRRPLASAERQTHHWR